MFSDYHIHSHFSGDSEADLDEIIQKAIKLNMDSICITDHQDFDFPGNANLFSVDLSNYIKAVEEAKERYKDRISIALGIETGLEPHLSEKLDSFVLDNPFDFVIGSSHLVNRQDPYYPEFWDNRSEETGYIEYFLSIIDNLKVCQNFDVYGHLDYIVRYSPNKSKYYSYDLYSNMIDEILKQIIAMGKGIEINTGGFKYGLGFANPHPDIVRRYKELGGEIVTIGSDAHKPEYIGYRFHKIHDLLSACGFRYYTVFQKRKPLFIPIE